MIIATAGHVDHGKTLLIKALTDVDTDRLPEEKKRGLTIDLGFAYKRTNDGRTLGFIAVPGHERFIHNMVSGVGAIDYALLVVAADDGVMPQTREHLAILDLLGVSMGTVVITKSDKVDRERMQQLHSQIPDLLDGTGLLGAPIRVASGMTGEGVPELLQHLQAADQAVSRRRDTGNFRLAVDRAFNVKGAGLVVTGSAFSGRVKVNDRMMVSPAGFEVRVRGLHVQGQSAMGGQAGDRCALNLAGIGVNEVARGDWILSPDIHAPTKRMDVRLTLLKSEPRPLRHWTPVHVHLASAHTTGRIALLGRGQPLPGETTWAQLVLDRPVSAVFGDRFIVRDQSASRTMGGGFVVDPFAPGRGRSRPERRLQRDALAINDPTEALTALADVSHLGVSLSPFAVSRNLTPTERQDVFDRASITVIGSSDPLGISQSQFTSIMRQIPDIVRRWHTDHAEKLGPSEHDVVELLKRKAHPRSINTAIGLLIDEGIICRRGTIIHDPDHIAKLGANDNALWQRVRPHIEGDNLRPPVLRELASIINIDHRVLQSFFQRAAGVGLVIRVADNRFFPTAAIERLAELASELADESEEGTFDARSYKDRSGIGRNVTIEVLEFFDKTGLTRRVGNKRRILAQPHEVFGTR